MIQRRSYFLENFLIFTCFAVYFLPGIRLTSGFGLRIDDILVLFIIPLIFLYRPRLLRSSILTLYSLSIVCIIISTFVGYLFLRVPAGIRDVNEIVRLSKPILLIILTLQSDTEYILEKVQSLIPSLTIFIIVVSFVQYFNIAGMREIIASLYTSEHHASAIAASGRIVITASDPNVAAAIVMFFWLCNLFDFIVKKNKSSLIFVFILTIIILMTSSRTTFLALFAIMLVFFFFSNKVNLIFKILLFLLIAGLIVFLYERFQYIVIGLGSAMSGTNNSLNIRFDNWREAITLFEQSPLFGWGPAKMTMETVVDGEYFLLLRRYGAIGTFIILLSIFYPLFAVKKQRETIFSKDMIIMDSTLKYYLVEIMFVMITNSFFSGYQLLLPFVFFCTVLYKEKKRCNLLAFRATGNI